ncbi:MAG: hypothetical protein JO001_06225 [Alphaproteobacteria bacterium]|nr:hypothetical protein [Alphaproteobacteria bacterium]
MSDVDLKRLINENAATLRELHRRIHETFLHRDETTEGYHEWGDTCKQFHASYDQLAFPGGYDRALDRIVDGDPNAVESAICFLERRPYFFRSGYMFQKLLRRVGHAPLTNDQARRFQQVLVKRDLWRSIKKRKRNPVTKPQ